MAKEEFPKPEESPIEEYKTGEIPIPSIRRGRGSPGSFYIVVYKKNGAYKVHPIIRQTSGVIGQTIHRYEPEQFTDREMAIQRANELVANPNDLGWHELDL